MSPGTPDLRRLRVLLLTTQGKPSLEELKRMVRKWRSQAAAGQDAVNRAMVRAIDEVQNRIDALSRL